ncbi:DoxX family protein [Rhodococcus sp. D2-41]|uniref:DoxX family protein n=1 Tax=Speluncibacter jeojiensis TaxID=2710754 RepID=A0A9X4LXC3_9ACTN|nr:DoxX family protein [Rhodococcus sp. D2-41]MDG3011014.1 DoxX family protein [Rhodococcus sp. D2-41]MDG3013989.1 DoxX family protein [Corynebacteriales bacterium D3-21]
MATTSGRTTARDFAVLALRAGVGGTLIAHGAQKMFGAFGGPGLERAGAGFETMGFTNGKQHARLAAATEIGGGALMIAGGATPAAAAATLGTMAVATAVHAPNGFFASNGGFEFPALLALTGTAIGIAGPGKFSLDAATGDRLNRPWMRGVALGAAAAGAAGFVSMLRGNRA